MAGCTGGDEVSPAHTLDVIVLEPTGPVVVGRPLELTLRTSGEGDGGDRVGLAWANASTGNIADRLLVEDTFDEVRWTAGPARLPAETTFTIEAVPDDPFLYVRGVLEQGDTRHWGQEMRIETTPPQPPLEVDIRLKNVPRETYWSNHHTLRVNVTGDPEQASRVGFSWSHSPASDWDLETLQPHRFEGSHMLNGSFDLPGEIRLPTWSVPTNTSIHMRAWVLVDGTYHWSRGYPVDLTDAPVYDHKASEADHVIEVQPSLIPLAYLDAFTPQELQIRKGESVRWVNQADAIHSASREANNTSFHTGNLGPGAASSVYRFLVPGEYSYRCRLHPETMEGVLVVTE